LGRASRDLWGGGCCRVVSPKAQQQQQRPEEEERGPRVQHHGTPQIVHTHTTHRKPLSVPQAKQP
jgi:hypothetical protein